MVQTLPKVRNHAHGFQPRRIRRPDPQGRVAPGTHKTSYEYLRLERIPGESRSQSPWKICALLLSQGWSYDDVADEIKKYQPNLQSALDKTEKALTAEREAKTARGAATRQREVMALVSAGMANREIATRLKVSEKTVKNHVNRIFRVFGSANRVEAVLI